MGFDVYVTNYFFLSSTMIVGEYEEVKPGVIREQTWDSILVYTWGNLSGHQWMDFRLALGEVETEAQATGVNIKRTGAMGEITTQATAKCINVKHVHAIGIAVSEGFVSVIVSRRDYKTEMLSCLPLFERRLKVFQEIISAEAREFRYLEHIQNVIEQNLDIDTAIEALPIYERDLGIETNKLLPYTQRREKIKAKNRSIFDQTSKRHIQDVAAAFSNGEVDIVGTDTPGVYQVVFVGTIGIPHDIEGIKQAIDAIIPAHLELVYTFLYNAWEFVSTKTWGDVADMTWDDIRVYEGGE